MLKSVIVIANQKGGVGKTTTSVNFAYELAKRGFKVLIIDLDSQGNLSKLLVRDVDNIDELNYTISDLIEDCIKGREPNLKVYNTFCKNMQIIPANIQMANTKLSLNQAIARETILRKIIKEIKIKYDYDYVIIDTAPSLDVDLVNALVCADEIIIPAMPDSLSTVGTNSLLKTVKIVRESLNSNLKVKGILITNVDSRTNFTKDMIEMLRETWNGTINVFNNIIPSSIRVKEGQALNKSISNYDKDNKVSKAYRDFTEEYLSID